MRSRRASSGVSLPSLEIEVFLLTYRHCSEIYIIIPVMFSLAFLTAILIDFDVCRLGLAAAGSRMCKNDVH